jgi:hypothetical protein
MWTGVFIQAAVNAGVAYQQTPGFAEIPGPVIDPDSLVWRTHWIRSNNFPGSYPLPDLVDMATQTDKVQELPFVAKLSYFGYASSFLYHAPPKQTLSRMQSKDSMSSEVTSIDTEPSDNSGIKNVCNICTANTIISHSTPQHTYHASRCPTEELYIPFMTSTLVHLNVGGVYYDTTIETLVRDSDSILCRMFRGVGVRDDGVHVVGSSVDVKSEYENVNNETPGVGSDGRFFIDRDGMNERLIF